MHIHQDMWSPLLTIITAKSSFIRAEALQQSLLYIIEQHLKKSKTYKTKILGHPWNIRIEFKDKNKMCL